MPSDKVAQFLRAKQILRLHRDWDDERVAEAAGIPKILIPEILGPARREVEQDAEPVRGP